MPEANLQVLRGGETVLGDYRVEYTPGHASHHVSYLHEPTGTAFVGDVAGVRIPPAGYVLAPTPPPDIDVEAWDALARPRRGLGARPRSRSPTSAASTTSARTSPPCASGSTRRSRSPPGTARRPSRPASASASRARAPDLAAQYEQAAPPEHLYLGVRRYLDKRA